MTSYAVVFEQTQNGWGAHVPDLPGCVAMGDTLEETEKLIGEALDLHLASMLEDGDAIPIPSARVGMLRAEVVEERFARTA